MFQEIGDKLGWFGLFQIIVSRSTVFYKVLLTLYFVWLLWFFSMFVKRGVVFVLINNFLQEKKEGKKKKILGKKRNCLDTGLFIAIKLLTLDPIIE